MKRFVLPLFAAVALCFGAWAMPAYQGAIPVTLADGTVVEVYRHGDAHFHYMTLADGRWVQFSKQGLLEEREPLSQQEIIKRRQAARRFMVQDDDQTYPLNKAPRGLIILVNFQDVQFQAENTREQFEQMHNSDNYTYNGATGSARQYFIDQSNGDYKPQFDVVGPVTLDNDVKYYGEDKTSEGDDIRAMDMVVEACQKAQSDYNVNFAQYDNDGDGEVDFVYVLYAGKGQNDSGSDDTIWPHMFWVYAFHGHRTGGPEVRLDGKLINTYACSAELNGRGERSGIGTFCHEFSHVLGLPDLYTTNGATHKTLGAWDILDYGPYNNNGKTPPAYSAYERFFMGWLTPTVVSEAQEIRLGALTDTNDAYLFSRTGNHNLQGNNPQPQEFYLIENRQHIDWDSYLPGTGMLLTKIDYKFSKWYDNVVNDTATAMGVDLIEADGVAPAYSRGNSGYRGKTTDAFPAGATSVVLFDDIYSLQGIEQTSDGSIELRVSSMVARYTVTFDAGEQGRCEVTELTEEGFGSGVTLPSVVENNMQYTFLGWATQADATTEDVLAAGTQYYPTDDITLYAIYREEPITQVYDYSGRAVDANDVNNLPTGLYIIKTEHGKKKLYILPQVANE